LKLIFRLQHTKALQPDLQNVNLSVYEATINAHQYADQGQISLT